MWIANFVIQSKKIKRGLTLPFLLLLLLTMPQCARIQQQSSVQLPADILGIYVGMKKEDANKRLGEIATFERNERKQQQMWRLNNDTRFSHLAVGYDKEDKVRYVTAFVDATTAKERIRFSDVGDLSKAKNEILEPHYRYIWDVPPVNGRPAFSVNIYGDNPQSLSFYSLSKKFEPAKPKAEENEFKE